MPSMTAANLTVNHFIRQVYHARWAYFFILPSFIMFVVFVALTIVQTVQLSFYETGLRTSQWIGLENYQTLLSDRIFHRGLRNTVVMVAGVVPATVILSLFIAAIAYTLPRGLQNIVRFAYYLPVVASAVILSLVWLWVLNPIFGVLNWTLSTLGLPPQLWLADPNLALLSVSIVLISFTVGEPVMLFMAALGSIPGELLDAAKVDGATGWQEFFKITLPLLRPTVLLVFVTRTIAIFQVFAVILLLTNGGPANATQTIVFRIYQLAFNQGAFGYAAAAGVVLAAIIILITLFQFRFAGEATDL
jgi:multiple sugar transport system permease protein